MPSDGLCAYVFKEEEGLDTDGSGPDEWRCSYDRKPDSPFCAQCRAMVDLMTPAAKRNAGPVEEPVAQKKAKIEGADA